MSTNKHGWATSPQVGDRLRDSWGCRLGENGRLWHVRGHIDGRVAIRRWCNPGWRYEFVADDPKEGILGYRHDGDPYPDLTLEEEDDLL